MYYNSKLKITYTNFFSKFRILYCITSSHYRTSFLQMVSCARLRGGANGGHENYIRGSRMGVARAGTLKTSAFRRRSIDGIKTRRSASMGTWPFKSRSSLNLRGADRRHEPSRISGRVASGALSDNHETRSSKKHSLAVQQTISIDYAELSP